MTTKAKALYGIDYVTAKRVANNTYRYTLANGDTVMRLHETDIIRISKDQEGKSVYTFDTGDWRTATTKDRMNRYSPVKIYSNKGKWWATYYPKGRRLLDSKTSEYFDGLMYSDGKFINGRPKTYSPYKRSNAARTIDDCETQAGFNFREATE